MLLFSQPEYDELAQALHGAVLLPGAWQLRRYPNAELYVTLETPVVGMPCAVLGSIGPPDEGLLGVSLLADTLHRLGARPLTAVLPYLAYARQEHDEPAHSRGTAWAGTLLEASGISRVVTVDIHSRQAAQRYPMPVESLSPAPIFAEALHVLGWRDAVLVAPDEGALHRAEAVRDATKHAYPLAHAEKTRRGDGVYVRLHGPVAPRAVVIDDMLDTGDTLVACCTALRAAGVREIVIMVTHGLFTGEGWRRLTEELGVTRIYCTDTRPLRPEAAAQAEVLSIAGLLREAVGG
jgi:ribose-phosphate pyrophosphokinase